MRLKLLLVEFRSKSYLKMSVSFCFSFYYRLLFRLLCLKNGQKTKQNKKLKWYFNSGFLKVRPRGGKTSPRPLPSALTETFKQQEEVLELKPWSLVPLWDCGLQFPLVVQHQHCNTLQQH